MHGHAILPAPRVERGDSHPAVAIRAGQVYRRYSIAKFQSFIHYRDRVSNWRILYVLVVIPLPGLVGALLSALIPLQPPSDGALANSGAHLRLAITLFNAMIGTSLHSRSVTGILHEDYTNLEILLSSLVGIIPFMAAEVALGFYWRYPIPMMWVMVGCPWFVCLVLGHCIVMRQRLLSIELKQRLVAYIPSLATQTAQIIIYPAFSLAFGSLNDWQQVILAIIFPMLKYLLKISVRKLAGTNADSSEVVVVTTIEIPASMYQTMIMQNSPSLIATGVVIGVDIVHGIISVLYFMDHRSCIPQGQLVESATNLLSNTSELPAMTDQALNAVATKYKVIFKRRPKAQPVRRRIAPGTRVPSDKRGVGPVLVAEVLDPATKAPHQRAAENASQRCQIVAHALEVMQSAEHILLVEYLEVAIPIVNTIFLAVAAQLDSAKYNPKLYPFHNSSDQFVSALSSLVLYILLQGISVVGMSMAMWYRYRLSAVAHLAFVLERHSTATQGLMFSWLGVLLHFSFVHYGESYL